MNTRALVAMLCLAMFAGCGDDDETTPDINLPTAPRDGLVAEYLFTGNAEDSQGTNDGVPTGSPTTTSDRFGHAGCAYLLDGVDDQIVTSADQFVSGDNVSVSLWFKVSSLTAADRSIVTCSDFMIWISGSTMGLAISTPITNSGTAEFTGADVWHHFLGTYDGTTIRCYLDSAAAGVVSHPGSLADPDYLLTFGYFNHDYWAGAVDDVRIYNRTISAASEISDLYHEGGFEPAR